MVQYHVTNQIWLCGYITEAHQSPLKGRGTLFIKSSSHHEKSLPFNRLSQNTVKWVKVREWVRAREAGMYSCCQGNEANVPCLVFLCWWFLSMQDIKTRASWLGHFSNCGMFLFVFMFSPYNGHTYTLSFCACECSPKGGPLWLSIKSTPTFDLVPKKSECKAMQHNFILCLLSRKKNRFLLFHISYFMQGINNLQVL